MVEIRGKRTTLFLSECYWVCMCVHRMSEREERSEELTDMKYSCHTWRFWNVKTYLCKLSFYYALHWEIVSRHLKVFTIFDSFVALSLYQNTTEWNTANTVFSKRGLTDSWLFAISNTLIGASYIKYWNQFYICVALCTKI